MGSTKARRAALAALLLALPAAAQEPPVATPQPEEPRAEAPAATGTTAPDVAAPAPGTVPLDRLLTLPSDREYGVETRGGDTRGAWRSRFQKLRGQLDAERKALADAQTELEEVAAGSSAWSIAPPIPGAQNVGEKPLDFELRQEMRRRRAEIEHLEDRMRELEIEANLAGVPEEWRE